LTAEEAEDPDDDDPEACIVFDDSAEGDRLHRYQARWSRALLRTLDTLAKLRKACAEEEPPADAPSTGRPAQNGQGEPAQNKPIASSIRREPPTTCVKTADAGKGRGVSQAGENAPPRNTPIPQNSPAGGRERGSSGNSPRTNSH
jgi:hypothetical protein